MIQKPTYEELEQRLRELENEVFEGTLTKVDFLHFKTP